MAVYDRALARMLPAVPKPIVRRIADRYIAGTELADACRLVKRLNGAGKMATIDVLGEAITSPDEARAIARAYDDVFDAIERERLDSNVSVKPTALGLELDYALFRENIEAVVRHAAESGNFVRIDMEDSSTTEATLRLYRELRERGLDNVGIVLQARLRRTRADTRGLAPLRPSVRLCKGIYLEPPEIAFQDREAIRASFMRALAALLDAGCYVGIATHDDVLIDDARRQVAERELGREEYEFQMLLGVRPGLGDALVRDGHRLRIYVPFGRQWYAYSLRRLQENPSIAGYIAADTVGRVLGRGNHRA
ncbi:MAG: proline dehydrogenase family protein [Thermoleophilia bacterium]|nr:proline dehydrogenase family protein [Thermoleophilia bacterium]